MPIAKFLQSALWSYNVKKLDPKRDKKYIISQILNHGTWEQVKWALKTYSRSEISEVLRNPSRGIWFDDALNFWLTIYKLKLPKQKYEQALFHLHPKVLKASDAKGFH
ncbi:MAG: DUF6922 domain-containing protein [Bacteroidota bacterium]